MPLTEIIEQIKSWHDGDIFGDANSPEYHCLQPTVEEYNQVIQSLESHAMNKNGSELI